MSLQAYLPQVKKLCEKYGILYHPQDEALITDLFPAEANQDKYNYLFFRTQDVYETYLELKKRQKELENQCGGTEEERYQLAADFGALLSYPEEGRPAATAGPFLIQSDFYLSPGSLLFAFYQVPPTWRFGQCLNSQLAAAC